MKGGTKVPTADGRLSNGILLNGVWKDYHDIIVSANELERFSNEMMGFLVEDRDSMAIERSLLLQEWRKSISSLTSVATNHLEAQQIIEQIRMEKQGLEMRCSSLETQRDWLDKQRLELRGQLSTVSQAMAALDIKLNVEQNQLNLEKSENNCLLEITYKRDVTIEELQKRSSKSEEECEVLQRSSSTKDRQFQTLLKERNRLKEELETATRELARGKRIQRQSQIANFTKNSLTASYSPIQKSSNSSQLLSVQSQFSPEPHTDDESNTPVGKENNFNTPLSSFEHHNPCDNTPQLIKNLHITEYKSMPPSNINETSLLPENEPNFDIRDKIYRSVIKKLQKELTAARNEINRTSVPCKSPSFRVTGK